MSKKGFTLLEMLVVVIIIGILVAIALPQYTSTIEKARSGEAATNVGSIRAALDRYWYQNTDLTTDINSLDIDNPNSVVNKLYTYAVSSVSTADGQRVYTVTATRTSAGTEYTVQWIQESNISGKLYRSANLGGPTP